MSAVTKFRCHVLITKVNNSDIQNVICNKYGVILTMLKYENIKIYGRITSPAIQRAIGHFHLSSS